MKKSQSFFECLLFAALLVLCACFAHAQTVYPFMAVGNAQFFNNNGAPLTAGVLYSFQAGTSTQQATYTDSTGTALNPNPIPFGSGARVSIWLSAANKYKFVLCLQNDGAACAPADVLFSVDQVPACPGCSTGGNTFTGTFISGTPNPATTGILELASLDAICWRNQAGTANLCITKDSSDVLSWTGNIVKFQESGCSPVLANYDYLCANAATHHLSIANNAGVYAAIATVPLAGAAAHLASFMPSGYDLQDSGATAPVTTAVTFSATPTFTASSQDQLFTMTLTGNVTSSTLVTTGLPTPSLVSFELTQDVTGGRTFVWPTNVLGAPTISPTIGAVTLAQFLWDGTNARAVSPVAPGSFNAPQRVALGSPVVLVANTQTIILTETVTFPSTPGTYRADSRYGAWITGSSNACAAEVIDTTNSRAFALNGVDGNGSGFEALAASEISSATYAASATATFTLQVQCNAGQTVTVNSGLFTFTPAEATYLSVTPVLSN